MSKTSRSKPEKLAGHSHRLDELTTEAERALLDLDASLTAAGALVDLSLSDGHSLNSQVLYKRMISLDFLLRQAGTAENIIWLAVNKVGMVANDEKS